MSLQSAEIKFVYYNYVRYLVAKKFNVKNVPYIYVSESPDIDNYVVGKFKDNKKKYIWKNPENIKLIKGDKVLVESNDIKNNTNKAIVTVASTFYSRNWRYKDCKNVIQKLDNKKIWRKTKIGTKVLL